MAVKNFRASDFPGGKKSKEQNNPPREDNKILQGEIDHAVRDENEGEKFVKEFGKKVDEADKKLNEEISHTEAPLDEQEAPKRTRKAPAAKKAAAAEKHIEDEVSKATLQDDNKK